MQYKQHEAGAGHANGRLNTGYSGINAADRRAYGFSQRMKTEHIQKPRQRRDFRVRRSLLRRGAEGGNRTHTVLLPQDFESSASASSTTSA